MRKGTKQLRPAWRKIVKKNERQGDKLFDVLVCTHAVPANDNTYRKVRSCLACAEYTERIRKERAAA